MWWVVVDVWGKVSFNWRGPLLHAQCGSCVDLRWVEMVLTFPTVESDLRGPKGVYIIFEI